MIYFVFLKLVNCSLIFQSCLFSLMRCINMYYSEPDACLFFLQSIGFIGPGISLIGLTRATSPLTASAWLTLAVGLKSFSHCGFLVNLQVPLKSTS